MRNYRSNAGTDVRLDYGVALVRGLSNFDKTLPLVPDFKALNDGLRAQYDARVALRIPWLEARQDVRFEDLNTDEVLRIYQATAKIADGGRVGPISKAVLRGGVTVALAPSGASQLPALNQVIDDLRNARVEGIDAFRDVEMPKLEAQRDKLETAVTTYQSARDAYYNAFAIEKGMRDEHRLAVDALMGSVRAAYPGDKRRQDTIFPDSFVASGRRDDGDDDSGDQGDDV